jgi:hypothetical protein
MSHTSSWMGQPLHTALAETPQMTLSFFTYGILLRKVLNDGTTTEYPVDASHIAQALAARVTFDTGLLDGSILSVRQVGLRQQIIGYRKPQLTGLWLEGQPEPLRVPLPGLVLAQTRIEGRTMETRVYAVKRRPTTLTAPLYHAPLPNVFNSGSVCWGSVPESEDLSLAATWTRLFGTAFGSHAVTGKSRQHGEDIRLGLRHHAQHARRWPTRDLISTDITLEALFRKDRP